MNQATSGTWHEHEAADAPLTPLVEELSSALDPWHVCRRLSHLPHLLFLDSALSHETVGRYSFVMADPFAWLKARGEHVTYSGPQANYGAATRWTTGNPFPILKMLLAPWQTETIAGLPPFQGGAAGLFGYDLCHHIERLPRPRTDEFQTPDLAVGLYDWVVAFDHVANRSWLISTGLPELDPRGRHRQAPPRLQQVRQFIPPD